MRLGTALLPRNQIVLGYSGLTKRHPNALRPIFRDLNFSAKLLRWLGSRGVGKSALLSCNA